MQGGPHDEEPPSPTIHSAEVENPWERSPGGRTEALAGTSSEQDTVEWPETLG